LAKGHSRERRTLSVGTLRTWAHPPQFKRGEKQSPRKGSNREGSRWADAYGKRLNHPGEYEGGWENSAQGTPRMDRYWRTLVPSPSELCRTGRFDRPYLIRRTGKKIAREQLRRITTCTTKWDGAFSAGQGRPVSTHPGAKVENGASGRNQYRRQYDRTLSREGGTSNQTGKVRSGLRARGIQRYCRFLGHTSDALNCEKPVDPTPLLFEDRHEPDLYKRRARRLGFEGKKKKNLGPRPRKHRHYCGTIKQSNPGRIKKCGST